MVATLQPQDAHTRPKQNKKNKIHHYRAIEHARQQWMGKFMRSARERGKNSNVPGSLRGRLRELVVRVSRSLI